MVIENSHARNPLTLRSAPALVHVQLWVHILDDTQTQSVHLRIATSTTAVKMPATKLLDKRVAEKNARNTGSIRGWLQKSCCTVSDSESESPPFCCCVVVFAGCDLIGCNKATGNTDGTGSILSDTCCLLLGHCKTTLRCSTQTHTLGDST